MSEYHCKRDLKRIRKKEKTVKKFEVKHCEYELHHVRNII